MSTIGLNELGYDQRLYMLAFDHRGSFEKMVGDVELVPGANTSNPAFAKYTACLKQHGVTLGSSNNQTAFAKASTACAKYRPTPGGSTQP